jgi:hypothetical protein
MIKLRGEIRNIEQERRGNRVKGKNVKERIIRATVSLDPVHGIDNEIEFLIPVEKISVLPIGTEMEIEIRKFK